MISNNPILITGSPRSGTTWVGRIISEAQNIRYIHEPFNVGSYPCKCGLSFKYWFQYLSSNNHIFKEHIKHVIYPAFSWIGLYNMVTKVYSSKKFRPLSNYLQSYFRYRPLLKDPNAVFSAKTLADWFDMDVVVLIRHPAAIVSSYKTLNWTHSFSHFVNQPELLDDHLFDFKSEIQDFVQHEHDIVDQASLLWKLIYHMVIKYQETQQGWYFIQYESIANNPLDGFEKIFNHLNLNFTEHCRQLIKNYTLQNSSDFAPGPYDIKQNPEHTITKWKEKLNPSEIQRIRARVEDVSSAFYTDDDW